MVTPRKPLDRGDADLMLMIGQLVEGAKAATEGLKSLGLEVRANATAVITAMHTVENLQEDIDQLDRIVRNVENPNHLVGIIGNHGIDLVALKAAVAELQKTVSKLLGNFTEIDAGQQQAAGVRHTLWYAAIGLAWATTTGVAIYAACK